MGRIVRNFWLIGEGLYSSKVRQPEELGCLFLEHCSTVEHPRMLIPERTIVLVSVRVFYHVLIYSG